MVAACISVQVTLATFTVQKWDWISINTVYLQTDGFKFAQ